MPQYPHFSDHDVDSIYHYIRWRARKDLAQGQQSAAAR
jgi:hypothetical protein